MSNEDMPRPAYVNHYLIELQWRKNIYKSCFGGNKTRSYKILLSIFKYDRIFPTDYIILLRRYILIVGNSLMLFY